MPVVVPRLIVEIFQHTNFRGRMGYVVEPVPFTAHIGFQDNISSLRVYKGPNFSSNPNYKVILHQHRDFRGKRLALGPGFYPNLHDTAFNFADRISSINFGSSLDVAGPEWGTIPLIVDCYEHVEFRGKKITILRDIANLRDPQGGTWFEDRISSIRIFKGPDFPRDGAEVVFYEHPEFEGASIPIRMEPSEYKKELPNLHLLPQNFGDSISAIKIEGWASSGEFTELVFEDEFIGNRMRPEWRWEDPQGGGAWAERQGYLEMRTDPGQDLWHGNGSGGDMSAPRLLMRVPGDFAIETRMRITPQLREHGGLLVWKNANRFLRLEKTSGPHAFRGDVRFERHVGRSFNLRGRGAGLRNVRELFLRLERRGNQFSSFASADGIQWKSCGQTNVGMGEATDVGLHALCPGNIPPTLTRFDYFRVFKRRSEVAEYRPVIAEQTGQMSDEERERRDADRRERAMRDMF
ncbi:MAG: beta/gamma crystallin-related protein [Candidatus Poribacteria bacterium]|nr:beta/gamma crystallin-related protein [Candidatus Poribacteria bacterium]